MPRHEFQPGKLIAGLALTGAGVAFAGDAAGWWATPWFVMIPVVVGGLCLAGAAASVTHAVRGRRDRGVRGLESPPRPGQGPAR